MVSDAYELSAHSSVRERIDVVRRVMGPVLGGQGYGKGRPLVDALEDVAQEAVLCGDFGLAQRFQDFAAYAGGTMYLRVLAAKYDEKARARSEAYARRMIGLGAERAVAVLDELCRSDPEATAADARELFRGVALSSEHVAVGDGEGGVRLSAEESGQLVELGRMELVLRNLRRSASTEAARMVGGFLADADAGLLAQLLELRARQAGLEALRAVVDDPDSSEHALHTRLKNQEWIFGGAYVTELARRQYTPDTILDIPLLRGDGSLHVVELKRARITDLVIRRSGHLMLGASAHHAVSQAQNYLRVMDENRADILAQHGVDTRRASATVVIGHPKYVTGAVTRREIAETLRTYNAHASRVEVITYETLLDSAARMLALASARQDQDQSQAQSRDRSRDRDRDRDRNRGRSEEPPA
ncbi:Shedu anti-phage system protein SduA domain-containing protein [Streptomyces fradiae]|uniref:Shedu anti-phage system protein SduA domain-containing protein n=1 Tax=Streptomyces fradiae TaxID=1906 RepID=UPI0035119B6B